jgi:hypothetical protein
MSCFHLSPFFIRFLPVGAGDIACWKRRTGLDVGGMQEAIVANSRRRDTHAGSADPCRRCRVHHRSSTVGGLPLIRDKQDRRRNRNANRDR